ncbi:Histidine kinase domain-containing protein [Sulfidibacter corallicola]|uniref:Histidine kinase domain-containing protein n=1 Tax=Sulfidibacter corallicola TaxID=2818388 RepID=A0A8A4TXG1_SULCO|nr:ATP-binding protein [Sulfidibacter corallicola]QTD53901.1 hypothetical protein J3U87_15745 [Sulfidibacter corallicola]
MAIDTHSSRPEPAADHDRFSGLLVILGSPLFLVALHFFALPAALDGFLFDRISRLLPKPPIAASPVVSITVDDHRIDPAVLLAALRDYDPRTIAFLFLPEGEAFADVAGEGRDLILGRALMPLSSRELALQSIDEALAHLPWAVLGHAELLGDSPRFQWTGYRLDERVYPGLEHHLAHPGEAVEKPRRFRVRFAGDGRSLPNLPASDIMDGAVPTDFLSDKILLVARTPPPEQRAFDRLRIARGHAVTRARYHASAVETLLLDRAPVETPVFIVWPCLLLYALALGVLFQRLQITTAFRVALVFLAIPLLLGWVGLLLGYWLFVADLILLDLILFLVMVFRKNLVLAGTLNRQIVDTSSFMQSRYMPKSFYASEQHWSQVANMVKQMLHIRRTIFLDRVIGDHRCREVISLNCSLDDIYEMRRDYERTPYTYALEANGPIRLERSYLRDQPENEAQFLIPLVFAGEVNGFWALGIEEENIGDLAIFESTLRETAVEIAEMLYHRRRYLQSVQAKGLIPALLTFNIDREMEQLLRESTALMERHLVRLESILQGQNTAVLIYDMFGQVLMINEGMAKALRDIEFAPYDNTLADLLQRVGGYADVQAKRLVLDILRHDQEFSFPLDLANQRTVLLVLRPLRTGRSELEASPFSKLGVLCEMVDITDLRRLSDMKEKIIRQTTMVLRNDIMGLSMAHDLITSETVPRADKLEMMEIAKEKMRSLTSLLEEGKGYLTSSVYDRGTPYFPVEFGPILEHALEESESLRQGRALTVELRKPELMNFVLASPNQLKELLIALLDVLMNDAEKNTTIGVDITEEDRQLNLYFRNRGYGIPEKQLAKILSDEPDFDLPLGLALKKRLKYIESWGGTVSLASTIGKGTTCSIKLRTFG